MVNIGNREYMNILNIANASTYSYHPTRTNLENSIQPTRPLFSIRYYSGCPNPKTQHRPNEVLVRAASSSAIFLCGRMSQSGLFLFRSKFLVADETVLSDYSPLSFSLSLARSHTHPHPNSSIQRPFPRNKDIVPTPPSLCPWCLMSY